MFIEKIKIKNFRNYQEEEINFDKNINIIYGDNAQGKTNILEAINICSTAKSHRNSKDNEIILFNKNEAHIKLFFEKENIKKTIDIQLNKETKKGIAINGLKVDKLSDFLGVFNVIFFAPEDLNIIKLGPAIRRKFLDTELCQIDKLYIKYLSNYNKILNQRNNLLKDIFTSFENDKKDLLILLETIDEQIIKEGKEIILKRIKNIDEINKKAKEIHKNITNGKEELFIEYETNTDINNYKKQFEREREKEILFKTTLIGPHRDDIKFMILQGTEKIDLRKFGSQGQKKTVAISLKLAELELLKEKKGETPVLLLDDVFSELDEKRQNLLIQNLKNVQTIVTCTGIKKNIFEMLKPNKIFNVKENRVKEINGK